VGSIDHDAPPFNELRLRALLPELFSQYSHVRLIAGTLKDKERAAIRDAMKRFNNNKAQVASHLGISSTTLWRRLKAMGRAR
jgi:transcriptional regulator with PAS, ATPase and Fis domain